MTCCIHTRRQTTTQQYNMHRCQSTIHLLGTQSKSTFNKCAKQFLVYRRAVDSTILTVLGAILSQQAKPKIDTLAKTRQLLDYLTSQEEAVSTYSASNIVLTVHKDVGYLNKPNTRSRVGENMFFSKSAVHPPNNGAILSIA